MVLLHSLCGCITLSMCHDHLDVLTFRKTLNKWRVANVNHTLLEFLDILPFISTILTPNRPVDFRTLELLSLDFQHDISRCSSAQC